MLESGSPVYVAIPGFPTGRYYDFVVSDPVTGGLVGVEVKTTLYDTIFFDESQVDKDVALLSNGGVFIPSWRGTITAVAYETFCSGCSVINLAKAELVFKLMCAGIRIRNYSWPGGTPPI